MVDIYSDRLIVERSGDAGIFKLYYTSSESNADSATCKLEIQSSGSIVYMTNDSTAGYFIYTFNPYTNIPVGEQTFDFTIYEPGGTIPVSKYSNKVTFRADLSTYMRSNVKSDGTSVIVYDVPVIEKEYYDSLTKKDFELEVLQALISSMDLTEARMLTDFTNIKFTNTYGILSNMLLNQATIADIEDIVETLPTSAEVNSKYIFSPCTGDDEYQDYIITCTDSTNLTFVYQEAVADSIAYVNSKGENYIYSDRGWIPLPLYSIPLEIEIEVFRSSTFSGTLTSLIDTVRQTIYDAFEDRFGTNATIYRSEIIDIRW